MGRQGGKIVREGCCCCAEAGRMVVDRGQGVWIERRCPDQVDMGTFARRERERETRERRWEERKKRKKKKKKR